MLSILEKLGLSEKEAKVYLAALELGASSVQKIAQKAKINRATTYVILESLRKKGLTTSYEHGKKTFFTAEPPQRLELLLKKGEDELKEKKNELFDVMPELKAIFNLAENKPRVKFYEGKEGRTAMEKDVLQKAKNTYTFTALDKYMEAFKDLGEEMVNERIKEKVSTHVIYTHRDGLVAGASSKEQLREARFVPHEKFPFKATIGLCLENNKIWIAVHRESFLGVVVVDADIAYSLKAIWNLGWEAAEKYNK